MWEASFDADIKYQKYCMGRIYPTRGFNESNPYYIKVFSSKEDTLAKKKEKVVLAYSGGLDTSVCVKWLQEEYGLEVITLTADLGQGLNFKTLKKRARNAGALKVYVEDVREEFVNNFVLRALKAGAVYESEYLLATALGRPLIAKKLVETAKKEGAKFVAHGCSGKGNDQVRIELGVGALAPKLKTIAPLREWKLKSREEEIEYAHTNKITVDVCKKSPYSIDKNLWGVSIECGVLEDPGIEPPPDAYRITTAPLNAPDKPVYVEIYFKKGVPERLNGQSCKPTDLILKLNRLGAKHGVGRTDLVENRLVGIKSREIYEAPAATILHTAHKALESLVLDRELAHFKQLLSMKYAELIYYGLWFSELREALDGFIDSTQRNVTGKVKLKLYKGSCLVAGRFSPHSLYKKALATYGREDRFDQSLAEGFIKIWGMPYRTTK